MKATVYYVSLTEDQRSQLNAGGWDSAIGRAYLDAKAGNPRPDAIALFEKAAVVNVADAEAAWILLQNGARPWHANDDYSTLCQVCTSFPRSMDVGDLVVWEDGRVERCASLGFEPAAVTADQLPK